MGVKEWISNKCEYEKRWNHYEPALTNIKEW